MLAEHLDYATIWCKFAAVSILREVVFDPKLLADLIDILQLVRRSFIGPKDTETINVHLHYVAKECTERPGILCLNRSRHIECLSIFAEVWKVECLFYVPSVRVGIGSHAASTSRS